MQLLFLTMCHGISRLVIAVSLTGSDFNAMYYHEPGSSWVFLCGIPLSVVIPRVRTLALAELMAFTTRTVCADMTCVRWGNAISY